MKKTFITLLFIPLFCSLASAEVKVDFDGKDGATANAGFTYENASDSIPAPAETVPHIVRTLEVQDENGKFVKVSPVKSWIDENGRASSEYLVHPYVKWQWHLQCKGTQQPNWTAKQTYAHSYGSGGHFHYNPPPPPLKITNISTNGSLPPDTSFKDVPSPIYFPSMQTTVDYYYWEWMPLFSTQIAETFEAYGACQSIQTDYLDVVQSTSLVKMSDGVGYKLVGDTPEHPDNHYVTPAFQKALQDIGAEWKRSCPNSALLNYNDASLVWGGLFDVNDNWNSPHLGHNKGLANDISKKYVRKGNRAKLIRIMCKKVNVYSEGDSTNPKEPVPHFHVQAKSASTKELDMDPRFTACCPGADGIIPKKCIDLESNGTSYPEDPHVPVETDCP